MNAADYVITRVQDVLGAFALSLESSHDAQEIRHEHSAIKTCKVQVTAHLWHEEHANGRRDHAQRTSRQHQVAVIRVDSNFADSISVKLGKADCPTVRASKSCASTHLRQEGHCT